MGKVNLRKKELLTGKPSFFRELAMPGITEGKKGLWQKKREVPVFHQRDAGSKGALKKRKRKKKKSTKPTSFFPKGRLFLIDGRESQQNHGGGRKEEIRTALRPRLLEECCRKRKRSRRNVSIVLHREKRQAQVRRREVMSLHEKKNSHTTWRYRRKWGANI